MIGFPKDKMISADDIETGYEKGTIEDCQEIEAIYLFVEKEIQNCEKDNDNIKFVKMTLQAHKQMIEERTDWEMCQKTVRRRRVIAMWHNANIMLSSLEDKTE